LRRRRNSEKQAIWSSKLQLHNIRKVAEEKRVAREEAKVVSDWAKAKKAAEIAIKKATENTKKSQPNSPIR
jgi:hypothetical protein